MTVRRKWQRGETVPIWAEVRLTSTGALYDPEDGVTVTLYKPDGSKVLDAEPMTKESTGLYVYYWNSKDTDTVGWYPVTVKVIDGLKITIEHGGFELTE